MSEKEISTLLIHPDEMQEEFYEKVRSKLNWPGSPFLLANHESVDLYPDDDIQIVIMYIKDERYFFIRAMQDLQRMKNSIEDMSFIIMTDLDHVIFEGLPSCTIFGLEDFEQVVEEAQRLYDFV